MLPREFCCSWSCKRYFVLIVSLLCTQPFCLRKGRTKPQHFFSVQSQINFKFTHILHFFVKWCLSPLYYFYEVPMVRSDYLPQQGDCTLWWNHDQTVLDLGAIIWLGFVSCTPGWSGWSQGMLCSRSFPQVQQPCVIFLCLVHRAAGKFIPGEAGWGAGRTGILLLLRNPTKLAGSSGGCGERKQPLPPLERWWWWVRDDFWENGETIPVWRQHLRGNHQSRVENKHVSRGECQQLVRKTQSKFSSWQAHLKLKYCFCF